MKKKTYKQVDEKGKVHQESTWNATPETDWFKIMAEQKQKKELHKKYLYFKTMKEKLEKQGFTPEKIQEILKEEYNNYGNK
jgi:hypothetical protein